MKREAMPTGMILVIFAIVALLVATSAFACTAFFKHDYVSGMNRVCVYNHLGSDYVITIPMHRICPINIQAPH